VAVDPYRAPREPVEGEDLEAQQGATVLLTLAGFVASGSGIMLLAAGWQLQSMLRFRYLWQEAWVHSIGLCGLVMLVAGGGYTQARRWSIYPTLLSSLLGSITSWAWAVYAFQNGGFNLINPAGAAGATCAALLTAISLGPAQRIARARAALFRDPAE